MTGRRRWLVVLCVLALLVVACVPVRRWRVMEITPADEEPIYLICVVGAPDDCQIAAPVPGTGRVPRLGMIGKQVGYDLVDFGGRWGKLRIFWPTPA